MHDRERADRPGDLRSVVGDRRLQRLELEPILSIQNLPATLAQPRADGVGTGEITVASQRSSLVDESPGLFSVR